MRLKNQKKDRFIKDFKLSPYEANVLVSDNNISQYFEDVIKNSDIKLAKNWIIVELFAVLNKKNLDINPILFLWIFRVEFLYGRRRGRKLSESCQLAIKNGKDFLIKEEDISNIFHYQKNIVLEIGFGDGENLINSAKINSNFFFIGADPFLNTTAKCLSKVLQYNLNNIVISNLKILKEKN